MTQYTLEISSYTGIVPFAVHFRGRVKGPYPELCCGRSTHFGATKSGKPECSNGHVLPDRVEWEVEEAWTQERYERWAAKGFEGDAPSQFRSEKDVMHRAIDQFLDGSGGEDRWWEQKVAPAEEGDELWYGWINDDAAELTVNELDEVRDWYGMMIARCQRG